MIQGDARNLKDVAAVVEGQEAACDCLGIRSFFTETKLFSTCAQNLVQALKRKQLLIAVIGMGAGDSRGCGPFFYDHVMLPLLLGRVYVDKDRQERIIMDNTARWVIVRPGFLSNGPRTGRYRALVDLQGVRGGRISRSDVADFILSQAKSPEFIGKTPLLIY